MPSGVSMLSTLRSNKAIMLDKSKRFKKTLGGYGKKSKTLYNLPSATQEDLSVIRTRLKTENHLIWLKTVVLSLLILVVLVCCFMLYK